MWRLTDQQRQLRERVREFALEVVRPRWTRGRGSGGACAHGLIGTSGRDRRRRLTGRATVDLLPGSAAHG